MKTKIPNKVNVITLGCSKNLVDSEYLLKQLSANGFKVVHDSNSPDCDIIVINTCGFINDAKQESIETILQFEVLKKQNKIKKLFVFGCLSERYKEELTKEIPNVDQYFGVYDLKELIESIGANYKEELLGERLITTPKHYAYLKISEGCDRGCSFCAIPLIKGKHVSKAIPDLIKEAEQLVKNGAKEIILIAQDLSYYGYDIYKKPKLAELLDQLSEIKGLKWLRLHYAYPAKFPKEVLLVMKSKTNICNYLDIPFQHISDKILKLMRRGNTRKQTYDLIDAFKKHIPDMAIRTTLLVGHPGETDEDFKELLDFVRYAKFDRLGVFTYSEEENTYSAINYTDDIPFSIKQSRMNEIMEVQRQISNELNSKKIGKIFKTIIDRKEGGFYIGRTEYDSPEVDNEVLIETENKLKIGQFYNARITKADDFDLYARIEK
ncbi:MAG: ribosomal protein S12 methylthiotransferase RimO [Bacteroidetes bacterium GWF2_33_16]|nr:MAG: ribosomal protein S12 methylthiotransferase RimO [Bacteroidetes bacterium GWE2_32_14]OFY07107.1 MAG: ribosomal protein S12 methylthiotransferase RimO [Bacteroidetes bacterium GWF2_33_16]